MRAFSQLYFDLEQAVNSGEKVKALKRYFLSGEPTERIWVLALLLGKFRPVRITAAVLNEALHLKTDLPNWLIQDSVQLVGDWVEVISLLAVETGQNEYDSNQMNWLDNLSSLEKTPMENRAVALVQIWSELSPKEILVFNKLISTRTRFGVKHLDIISAVSEAFMMEPAHVAYRLSENWKPEAFTLDELLFDQNFDQEGGKPFPFEPSEKIENPEKLEDQGNYLAEWKMEGIRLQVIRRNGGTHIWNREYERLTTKLSELNSVLTHIPNGTVLDVQLIHTNIQLGHSLIQQANKELRNKRNNHFALIAFDLLEINSQDIRSLPLIERRTLLENLVAEIGQNQLLLSSQIKFSIWSDLTVVLSKSRENQGCGIILKQKGAGYGSGSWKIWRPQPLVVHAVLLYVQKGVDNFYSEWTVGLRDDDRWVSFAKVKSPLSEQENKQISAFVKENTLEKFGPVRTIKPELIVEVSFQGIQPSRRHKSGFSVQEPKAIKWLKNLNLNEVHSVNYLKSIVDIVA